MEAAAQQPVNLIQQGVIIYKHHEKDVDHRTHKKAHMSDEYINYRASKEAHDQYKESPARKLAPAVGVGALAAESVALGALGATNVVDKAKLTMGRAGFWGVAVGATLAINKAVNYITDKIKPIKNFKEEHPNASSVGILLGSGLAGFTAANPLIEKASKLFNNNTGKQIQQGVKNLIEKPFKNNGFSKFVDKQVFQRVGNLLSTPARVNMAHMGALALLGGVFAKNMLDASSAQKKQQDVKHRLELERLQSQLKIAKNSSTEKNEINIFAVESPAGIDS